jgi:hypothetical protein
MDRVTAEVAEEVGMLFQDDHVDASAGQQISQHHACGTTTNDATAGLPPGFGLRRFAHFSLLCWQQQTA